MKSLIKTVCVLYGLLLFAFACNPTPPLDKGDPRLTVLALNFAENCFESPKSDIGTDFSVLKTILDEAYVDKSGTPSTNPQLKDLGNGYELTEYPQGSGTASGVVARPIAASLAKFVIANTWDNMMDVYTGRYTSYERTYTKGDVDSFRKGDIDTLDCTNHLIDIGQRDISFEYNTIMNFKMYKGDGLPEEGVLVECTYMPEKAVRVAGGYNSWMDLLYSVIVYYPIDKDTTYRTVFSWVYAGGSLFIFGANANSGDVGIGIIDEFEGITAFVTNPLNFP